MHGRARRRDLWRFRITLTYLKRAAKTASTAEPARKVVADMLAKINQRGEEAVRATETYQSLSRKVVTTFGLRIGTQGLQGRPGPAWRFDSFELVLPCRSPCLTHRSNQTSSMRQPLKMLFTMMVIPLT